MTSKFDVAKQLVLLSNSLKDSDDFFSGLYGNGNPTQPVNTETDPDQIKKYPLYQLMLNRNYKDAASKGADMDVSPHFTDMLIEIGKFHAQVDKQKGSEGLVQQVRQALNDTVVRLLSTKKSDAVRITGLVGAQYAPYMNTEFLNKNIGSKNVLSEKLINMVGISEDDTIHQVITKTLVALTVGIMINSRVASPENLNVAYSSNLANFTFSKYVRVISSGNLMWLTPNFGNFMSFFFGDCDTVKTNNNYLFNLCSEILFDSKSKSNAIKLIREFDTQNGGTTFTSTNVVSNIKEAYVEYAEFLYTHYKYGQQLFNAAKKIAEDIGVNPSVDYEPLKKLAIEIASDADGVKKFNQYLVDKITKNVSDHATPRTVTSTFLGSTTTLRSDIQKLFADVYAPHRWANLKPFVKNVYRETIDVLKYNAANNKWERVDESDYHNIDASNYNNYRFNLRKTNVMGGYTTIFENKIPFLSKSLVGDIMYTNQLGNIKRIPNADIDAHTLRNLYRLATGETTGSASKLGLTLTNFRSSSVGLPLDNQKFFVNYFKDSDSISSSPSSSLSFDDLAVNMVTGEVWQRDSAGTLYRMENGQPVYSSGIQNNNSNCLGARLKANGDDDGCARYIRDVLSGDMRGLKGVMDSLDDKDMFDVAQDELSKVDPYIAMVILKRFGFRQTVPDNNGIVSIEDYDNWEQEVLAKQIDSDVRKVIEQNTKLLDYLKGVVAYINNNPKILNKNASSNTVSSLPNKSNGLKWYQDIFKQGSFQKGFLFNVSNKMSGIPSTTNISIISNDLSEAILPAGTSYFSQIGGAPPSTSMMLKSLFDETLQNLASNNLNMSQDDKTRVMDGLIKIERLENKFVEYMNLLQKFNTLAEYFKNTGCIPSNSSRNISLKNILTKQHSIDWLAKNTVDLQQSVSDNQTQQQKISNKVLQSFEELLGSPSGMGPIRMP